MTSDNKQKYSDNTQKRCHVYCIFINSFTDINNYPHV